MATSKENCAVGSPAHSAGTQVSLCEVLDRVLNKGAVVTGEIMISVAGIELLYVGIGLVIGSVETLLEAMNEEERTSTLGSS